MKHCIPLIFTLAFPGGLFANGAALDQLIGKQDPNIYSADAIPPVAAPVRYEENELPPTVRAFLDMLAFAEGTHKKYNLQFTHRTFTSYANHPRRKICSRRYCSTAAGRYQFLARTWDMLAKKMGLADFSPANQDRAAIELIRRSGAYRAVLHSNRKSKFNAAVLKVHNVWAALPGSKYGQPRKSMSELWTVYRKALAEYRQNQADPL